MAGDVLHQPLGQPRDPKAGSRVGRGPWKTVGVVAAAALVLGAGTVTVVRHRPGMKPDLAVATIEPAAPAPAVVSPAPAPAAPKNGAADDADATGAITVIRPPGAALPTASFIKIPDAPAAGLQPAPDPRLVEKSRFGLLPRRGSAGARPLDIYARPATTDASLRSDAPRIAIMVGGMGLNVASTAAAATALPAAVTLGFAPYGADLERQVQGGREAGHEVILQVPMEGFGDPSSAAMSHLLLAGADGRDNLDRLHWHMGRFTGYVGVANFLGGKFAAEETALEPVLRDVAARGLLYFDDGSAPRSLAPTLAGADAVPLVRADVVIDASGDQAAIDSALAKLESRARDHGVAVGFANGLPASIDRIAVFARGLSQRGIALVPVSALALVPTATAGVVAQP